MSEPRKSSSVPPRVRLAASALALLVFGLYARSAGFGFVAFDDPVYVRDNAQVGAGLTLDGLRWALGFHAGNWHPLTWLSHMLDVELFGPEPGAQHLVNAGLHALNALLVFALAARLGRRPWTALLTAALFALHPLRVESVAWISERKDVLSGALYLATLLAWLGWVRAPSARRYALALGLFALGLMAKSMLVTLPVVLLLLAWCLRERPPGARLLLPVAPFFALALATGLATLWIQRAEGAVGGLDALTLAQRSANALRTYGVYVLQSVWPSDLACLVPHPVAITPREELLRVLYLPALLGAALLGLALALALRARRTRPELLFGLAWYLVVAAPVIGFVQVGVQAHADRYTYLPTLGLACALATTLARLGDARPRLRPALVSTSLGVLAALALLSLGQLATWRDSRTLFTHALAVTEKNWVAATYLGEVERRAGELEAARAHLEFALAAQKTHVPAMFELALVALGQDELLDARRSLKRVLRNEPTHPQAGRMLERVEREIEQRGLRGE